MKQGFFIGSPRRDSSFKRLIIHVVLIVVCIVTVFPVLRIMTVSLRATGQLFSSSLRIIPENAGLGNYAYVILQTDFLLWLWNSIIITVATSLIGVIVAATSAYAFSRWSFPGRKSALIFLLTTQMIPAGMLMIPIYIISARLGLIDTWRGIVVAYSVGAIPFSIWILKGYYDTIPRELEQAAMVDGLSRLGSFFRIILPLSIPALAIALLFNFTQVWNDYLLARILLQKPDLATWPLGLQRMQEQYQTQWGNFAAASLMVSVPVMTLFLLSSRWLISGLTIGSVKG